MQDRMSRSNDPNDYIVHDPLLEKGKQTFNRMVAKQKQRGREWAGRSLTWSHICWLRKQACEYFKTNGAMEVTSLVSWPFDFVMFF